MKANFTLINPIQLGGKYAVMTGNDTIVKAAPFRGSDEILASSFHENRLHTVGDRPAEPRRGRPEYKKRSGGHPHSSAHCDCRTAALLPIGLDLRDLRRLRSLYEIQPGHSLCVCPMGGTSIRTDTTIHRSCMLRRGHAYGSLRTGKPESIVGLNRSKAVAISSRKLSACFKSIFCLGADFWLRLEVERKGAP